MMPPASDAHTVLLVDDEPMICRVICSYLRSRDYTVLEATSGQKALEMLRTEGIAPSLAIIDLLMPGISGLELLEKLRESDPELPALLISGFFANTVSLNDSLDERTQFLQKPFNFKMLEVQMMKLFQQDVRSRTISG